VKLLQLAMIRRINHTGRKRIGRSQVRVEVDDRTQPATFAAHLALDPKNYPGDAKVVVEAYRGSGGHWSAYDWGRVAALRKPATATLAGFETVDGLLFRVRVVSTREPHKIVAEADQLPFVRIGEEPTTHKWLIDVKSADLGDLVWEVDLDAEPPLLLINKALGNWKAVTHDRTFRALVLPEVFRSILVELLLVQQWSEDAESEDWRARWLRFSRKLAPGFSEPLVEEERREFIEAAVAALARQLRAREEFARHLLPEDEA
jgi:hypothetical protein